ncbi:DUF6801 domain-containing protein [Aeromicrobium sp.]|uniref:DUF6801 domain-containing protein n=1 Tax=Aeromicrobium sp. TaxID=1871063 RepID=UPI0028AC0555|nr:DUF6801 domain-containing protein [Aeromicrobium sp.]
MRPSASVRRALRFAVASAVVGASAVHLSAPAQAAPASIDRVPYVCKALNNTIDLSLQGPKQFYVTSETDLPASVQPGDTVPATETTLTLALSTPLVDRLYGPMKVRKVKGSSTTKVDLQAVAPGGELIETMSPVVKGPNGEPGPLVNDWVNLTPGQEVSIVADGVVDPVTVPQSDQTTGLIYVQMPLTFMLHSEMDPPVVGSIAKADLKCTRGVLNSAGTEVVADKEHRIIGTIAVGAGCSQTECPPPPVGSGDDTGGGGDDDLPPGSGTDPEVIDPVNPDDETDIDDSGYDWDEDGSDSDGNTTGVSDETTELPATGSPFAAGLAGLFGVLLAVRLALGVRARRTGA